MMMHRSKLRAVRAMLTHSQLAPATAETSSRGDVARDKMLRAALDVFGEHGFAAATTRMVAQAANMNLGAIPYYFGSKEEMYTQAAKFLAAHIEQHQAEPLLALRQGTAAPQCSRTDLIEHAVQFMLSQARMLLSGQVKASWVQFFLRAQAENNAAFERIFAHTIEPVQATLTEVVGRITGCTPDSVETRTLTFLIFHQVMSLRLADTVLLRRLNWQAINPQRLETLLNIMGQALRAQLSAYSPCSDATP